MNANGKGNGKARAPIRAGVLRALILAGLLPVVLTFVANQTLTRQALLDSEYDKMSVLAYEVVRQIEEVMTTAAGSLAALASPANCPSRPLTHTRVSRGPRYRPRSACPQPSTATCVTHPPVIGGPK